MKNSNQPNNQFREAYRKPGALIATLLIVLLGAVLTSVVIMPRGERINSDGYQVVYMVSGQAYFGKLQNTDGTYLTLHNPYTAQNVTPQDATSDTASKQASTTLLKVSQQTYGPDEVISLSRDQVLFWQNLRQDSKVVKAIENKQ